MPRKPSLSAGSGLRDAILAEATATPHGPAPWHQRVEPEVFADLLSVRADYRAGTITASRWTLAGVIARKLAGVMTRPPSQVVVDRWLALRD